MIYFKLHTVLGHEPDRAIAHATWQPAKKPRGRWPGGPVQRGKRPACQRGGTCAPSALAARSPRAVRAWDNMVVRSPTARWWLAGGKVYPRSTSGPQGGAEQCGGRRSTPRNRVDVGGGGEKAVAHRCSEAAAGSSSLSRRWGSLTLQR
jgi:hypothetical protein